MKIQQLLDIAFHRNGISGAPFHIVLFEDTGDEASRKVAIVFDAPHHVAVLDIAELFVGEIDFGKNSWRGDVYEPELRAAIEYWTSQLESSNVTSTNAGGQS